MEHKKTKTPTWFWAVTAFFLLWNILGVLSFVAHVFITEEALAALPTNERELYNEYPLWTTVVFAIAVLSGLLGSMGLVVKKKWAKSAFIVSFLAVIPQMIHNVFFTHAIEVYGTVQAVTMPILVVVFGLFLVWFSTLATKKQWLH